MENERMYKFMTPVEVWAKAAIDVAGARERRSYPEELDALGFNIKLEAKRLEEFYLEKIVGE